MKTNAYTNASVNLPSSFTRRRLAILLATIAVTWLPTLATGESIIKQLYDANGNPTATYDPLGRTSVMEYDALGRVVKSAPYIGTQDATTGAVSPSGTLSGSTVGITPPSISTSTAPYGMGQYSYDGFGRLNKVTDPRGMVTTYTYNGFDQLISQTSPDTSVTSNTYYNNGQLKTRKDAKGNLTTYTYWDEAGKVNLPKTVTYTNAAVTTGVTKYVVSFAYYPISATSGTSGKLQTVTETQTTVATAGSTPVVSTESILSYTYDNLGRVNSVASSIGLAVSPRKTSYSYDAAKGQLASITYPSGRIVNFTYNDKGQVGKVTTKANATATAVNLVTGVGGGNITYQPFGGIKGMQLANGLDASRTYDNQGRLSSYKLHNPANQTDSLRTLKYDQAGRIDTYYHAANASNQFIRYDNLDRVKRFQFNQGQRDYTYDNNGNRASAKIGTSTNIYSNDTDSAPSNQLLNITNNANTVNVFTHDTNGNIVSNLNTNTYVYDLRNRLVAVKSKANGATLASYQYNAMGKRISKTLYQASGLVTANITTYFYYDQAGQLIYEHTGSNTNEMEYLYFGNLPVAVVKGRNTLYTVQADHINTPRIITDANKAVVWNWKSTDPFGALQPTGALTMNLRFPGQYFDKETNLHHNGFRDYNPELGRYVRRDQRSVRADK